MDMLTSFAVSKIPGLGGVSFYCTRFHFVRSILTRDSENNITQRIPTSNRSLRVLS